MPTRGQRRYRMAPVSVRHASAEVPPLRRPRPFDPIRPRQHRVCALTLTLALAWPALSTAGLTARVTPPALDGTLELTLEAERAPMAEPDLSALERDFEVLASRNQHQSFMVNGRRSDSFSLILTLRPRREGVTEVPPIEYGTETTQPVALLAAASAPAPAPAQAQAQAQATTPGPSPAEPHRAAPAAGSAAGSTGLILEAEVSPQELRVQQQAILIARVLAPRSLSTRPRLYEPKIAGANLVPLGEDDYELTRAGEPHEVYERRYALFPTRSGTLTVEPLMADAWIGGAGMAAPSTQRAASPALTLTVEPAAPGPAGKAWLPASSVKLTEAQAGLVRVHSGETWQRVIIVQAAGQPASALPALTVPAPTQLTTRAGYPKLWDERQEDALVGNRAEVILIAGNEPGLYRLPEVRLDWWNSATQGWELATLPARDLEIVAAAVPLAPTAEATQTGAAAGADQAQPSAQAESRATGWAWAWALIALGLGWMAMHRLRRRNGLAAVPAPAPAPAPPPEPKPDPGVAAIAAVRSAYQANNAEAARRALLAWAGLAWPHNPPGNLTQVALRSPEPSRGRIILLEQAFYSPEPIDWARDPLWEDLPLIAEAAALEPPPPPPKRRIGTPRPRET